MAIVDPIDTPGGLAFDTNGLHLYLLDHKLKLHKFQAEKNEYMGTVVDFSQFGHYPNAGVKDVLFHDGKLYICGFKTDEAVAAYSRRRRQWIHYLFVQSLL